MRLLVLVVAGAVLVAGCGGGTPGEADSAASDETSVVVTSKDERVPRSCRPGPVARQLVRFTDALRSGNLAEVKPFWKPRFFWFTVNSEQRRYGGEQIEGALGDVEKARGFDIRFEEVAVSRGVIRVGMSLEGTWTSESGRERPIQGKAEMTCREGNIYVMGLALPPPGEPIGVADCPSPHRDHPGHVLVACLRPGRE